MNKAAKSILFFGSYILVTGLVLLMIPELLLRLLMINDTADIWIRLLGLALSALGYYYVKAARDGNIDFFKGTIPVRIAQFAVVVVLVVLYDGPYILIGISAIEALSGIVTYYYIHKG